MHSTSTPASALKAVLLGDVYVNDVTAKPSGVHFRDERTRRGCLRATVNLRTPQPFIALVNCACSTSDSCWNRNPSSQLGLKNSSFACYSAGAAHDIGHLANPTFSTDPCVTNVGGESLKLFSGSCYLPHPDKEDTGGEDAHFICTDEQAIGVADGVGGWADVGVNAGLFARELMANAVRAIEEEP